MKRSYLKRQGIVAVFELVVEDKGDHHSLRVIPLLHVIFKVSF